MDARAVAENLANSFLTEPRSFDNSDMRFLFCSILVSIGFSNEVISSSSLSACSSMILKLLLVSLAQLVRCAKSRFCFFSYKGFARRNSTFEISKVKVRHLMFFQHYNPGFNTN